MPAPDDRHNRGSRETPAPDVWYYADEGGQIGPLSLAELKDALATLPHASDVLVWAKHFVDWKRAKDVPELMASVPSLVALDKQEMGAPTGTALGRSDYPIQANTPRPLTEAKANYIVRHWRGELSLPMSYWVNGVVLGLAATFTADVVILYMKPTTSEVIALLAGYLGFFGWAWIGIWRSAGRRTPKGPDGWGWAARVAIILGAIRVASDLAEFIRTINNAATAG